MNEIRKIIKNRIETLQRGIDTAKLDAKGFPEGQLRITGKNIPEYYRILGDKQEYLGRDKAKTIISLAQKSYNKDFIKKATTELTYFEKILRHLPEGDAESVFQKLPLRRQNIVEPYILPDEIYKKRWDLFTRISLCWIFQRERKFIGSTLACSMTITIFTKISASSMNIGTTAFIKGRI